MKTQYQSMLKREICNCCKKEVARGLLKDSGPPRFQRLCPDCLRWQCKVCGFVCRSVLDRAPMDMDNGVCPTCMATYNKVRALLEVAHESRLKQAIAETVITCPRELREKDDEHE